MTILNLKRDDLSRLALWAAMAVAAGWLLSPMFFSQHLEGYTTNLKAIALMANRGDPLGQDLMSPALTEFLYYTRAGVIGLLRLSGKLFGDIGDWDFRGLMILSFAAVAGCSVFIARRLGEVRGWSAIAALLLVPGVSEVAFHFNDSLPSAAFAIGAVALVAAWDRLPSYFIAGALCAAAMLCRLDGILLAPAVMGVAWLGHRGFGALARRALAAALGFLGGLALGALLLDTTPIDAFVVSLRFFPGAGTLTTLVMAGFFFGAGGALLLLIGLVASLRGVTWNGRGLPWLAVWVLHPALILAAALKLSTETRYIYPLLTPFVAVYGGRGLEALVRGLRGTRRRASVAALLLLLLLVAVPPAATAVRDGPRSPVGRLWMPALWWRWENIMAESLRRVEALVELASRSPRLLLVSTHFNDDFFLKQRFLAAGWQVRPAEEAFPGCSGFSVYAKDDRLVAHIKTERQYGQVKTSKTRLRALLIDRSLSCRPLRSFDHAYLTLWSDDKRVTSFADTIDPRLLGFLLPRLRPLETLSGSFTAASVFHWPFWRPRSAEAGVPRYQLQGMFHAYPLSRLEVETIAGAARAYLRLPVQPSPEKEDQIVRYEDFREAYKARCKDPREADWTDLPLCGR